MIKSLISLTILTAAWGCGDDYRRKAKASRAEAEALKKDLAESEAKRKEAEASTAGLESTVKTLNLEVKSTSDQLSAKTKLVADQEASIKDLESKVAARDEEVASTRLALERLEASVNESGVDRAALLEERARLRAKLTEVEKARETLGSNLKKAQDEQKRALKALEEQRTRAMQAFLENAAPETMFAAETGDLETLFKLNGRECAVVLDLGKDLEVVRGTDREDLPNISGYEVLPMRVAFKKAFVCQAGGQTQVQTEEGYLYRMFPQSSSEATALVTGRVKGTCDDKSEAVKTANVLGANAFQVVVPFRGSIDGIETIDLPRQDPKPLRLHMGSAVAGAATCAKAVQTPGTSPVLMAACQVILSQPLTTGVPQVGCFSENKSGDVTELSFTN